MPKGIGIIRWNNQLGPFLEMVYPESITLNPQLVVHLYTSQTMGDIATPRVTSLSSEDLRIVSYFGGHQDPSILMLFLAKNEIPEVFKKGLIDAFISMPKETEPLKDWLIQTLNKFKASQPTKDQDTEFRKKVQQILNVINDQQISKISPEFNFETGIRYSHLEALLTLPHLEIGRLLERLANFGYLIREIQDSIPTCPDCHSVKLQIKWACSICKSTSLEKTLIFEHFVCGTKTVGEKFITSKGLFCPKCNLPLKAEGIDYAPLGIFHYCHTCKNFFNAPLKFLLCHNCGIKFPEDNANLTLLIGYKMNKELIKKFLEHPETLLQEGVNMNE